MGFDPLYESAGESITTRDVQGIAIITDG